MQPRITFSSVLGTSFREALEKLLFFNPQQDKARSAIHESIAEYGLPTIHLDKDRLRVRVAGLPGAQALFALEESGNGQALVGVMVYARVDLESLVLVHIAVAEEYSQAGEKAGTGLVTMYLGQLRQIARKVKGVRSITVKYASGLVLPI